MLLTTEQVATKLDVHKSTVARFVKEGKLIPANKRTDGHRQHFRFDSKIVNDFKATFAKASRGRRRGSNGADGLPVASVPTVVNPGIRLSDMADRLADIELVQREILNQLAVMLALWS